MDSFTLISILFMMLFAPVLHRGEGGGLMKSTIIDYISF